ncbi:MAG: leucine-rich repeat domain-containing protein, partial [Paludibacteraceae bacterium]|nr:leucine-rich repeat domain-containing protein [Paludibacteraceae bacterium]
TLPANWTGTKPNEQGKWYGGVFNLAAPAKTSVITYTATKKLPEVTSDDSWGLHTNAIYAADSTLLTITDHSFSEGVGTVTLNGELAIIGDYAFFHSSLTSITIPAGVTTIGEMAFYKTDLTSVTIPASVTTIGMGAFAGCSAMASVTFEGNACQDAIGEYAFDGVGDPDPALLTLNGIWAKENLPDEDGNWYGGKFELLNDPTALEKVDGGQCTKHGAKFMHNGRFFIVRDGKKINALGF